MEEILAPLAVYDNNEIISLCTTMINRISNGNYLLFRFHGCGLFSRSRYFKPIIWIGAKTMFGAPAGFINKLWIYLMNQIGTTGPLSYGFKKLGKYLRTSSSNIRFNN